MFDTNFTISDNEVCELTVTIDPVSINPAILKTITGTDLVIGSLPKFNPHEYLMYENRIKKVIFNDPATIILWKDGTKTVVKVKPGEKFDKWTGFAMACMKKLKGNDFHAFFRHWCEDKKDEK